MDHETLASATAYGYLQTFVQEALWLRSELFISCKNEEYDNLYIHGEKLYGMVLGLGITQAIEPIKLIKDTRDKVLVKQALKAFYKIVFFYDERKRFLPLYFDDVMCLMINSIFYEKTGSLLRAYRVTSYPCLAASHATSADWQAIDIDGCEVTFGSSARYETYGPVLLYQFL